MKNVKLFFVKVTEKSLIAIAEMFSTAICYGRHYEPKMPEKLKK